MKFSIKHFFSKCDQIHRKLRIWSHLLKKSLIENFVYCAVIMVLDGFIFNWYILILYKSQFSNVFYKIQARLLWHFNQTFGIKSLVSDAKSLSLVALVSDVLMDNRRESSNLLVRTWRFMHIQTRVRVS